MSIALIAYCKRPDHVGGFTALGKRLIVIVRQLDLAHLKQRLIDVNSQS